MLFPELSNVDLYGVLIERALITRMIEVSNHKNYLKEGLKLIYCYHTDVMSMNLQALLQALLNHSARFFGLQVNLN